MAGSTETLPASLVRYRGEPDPPRAYPDLHDHVLALYRAGRLHRDRGADQQRQ